MRRLVASREHAVRLSVARAQLVQEVSTPILLLAPTKRAADDFVKTAGPGPRSQGVGRLGAHRLTLDYLARDLASLAFADAKVVRIAALGTEALAARAVHVARAAEPLGYFEPVADTPGFARAVARTLREVREEGIDADSLTGAGEGGADLTRLMRAFEAELWSLGLADRAKSLTTAADVADRGGHPLVGLPLLLLDVLPRTNAERALLRALAQKAPTILATAPAHDTEELEALATLIDAEVEFVDEQDSTGLARARRFVFQAERPEESAADESLGFFSAPGEARECVEIARRIKRLAARGIPFDRVAVLLRSPTTYTPLLSDALRRADIPGFFTRGARRPDPAGRALLALLACAEEGLSASRFAEYLSLGCTPQLTESGAPVVRDVAWVPAKEDGQMVFFTKAPPAESTPREVDKPLDVPLYWERLLVDAAVIGTKARWARRLAGLARELSLQIESLGEDQRGRRKKKERDLEQLKNLEAFALPIVEFLDDLPDSAPWRVWIDRLRELASLALADPEPVLALLQELLPMGEVGPVGLLEVHMVLQDRLSFFAEDPDGSRFGRVFVAPIEEALGRTFDVVFVPGLAEGIFPRRVYEDPLLLDDARTRLGIQGRARHLAEERDRLHTALGAASDHIVISYPRMNVMHGRPRVPSFYALDVLRAAEGRLPDLAALFERASGAADSRIGWPAPRSENDAIDDAEYDLAILAPLVFEKPEAIEGRGRYLIENEVGRDTNPFLVRALRACASRWRSPWRANDGLVDPPEDVKRALARHRPKNRSYSPTALQSYAYCPYRFLLHSVYYIRERSRALPLEELDPLTRGALFHHVQFLLFGEFRDKALLPITDVGLDEALALADTVFRSVAEQYEEELAPALPRVWAKEMDGIRTDLRGWLRDAAARHADWTPIHAELAFGLRPDDERDPESTSKPARILDRFDVRGAIDLVERHNTTGEVRVTDHKTGRAPDPYPLTVGGGKFLQPLVYALAAEEMLGEPVGVGRLYYCTARGNFEEVVIPSNDATREKLTTVLETIDEAITAGFLPAAPNEGACRYCDYRFVCGPNEEDRVRRKQPDALVRLNELRELP